MSSHKPIKVRSSTHEAFKNLAKEHDLKFDHLLRIMMSDFIATQKMKDLK